MSERLGATYTYTDTKGRPVLRKVRREGWTSRGRKFRNEAAVYRHDRLQWRFKRGSFDRYQPDWKDRAMYNLENLLSALRAGEPVHVVEGERDADTGAALFGWATTTNWQGASEFTCEQARWFTKYGSRSRINLLIDNDPVGHHAADMRRTRLIKAGVAKKRIRMYRPADPSHSDLTDVALGRAVAAGALRGDAWVRVRPGPLRAAADAYRADVATGGKRGSSDWRVP